MPRRTSKPYPTSSRIHDSFDSSFRTSGTATSHSVALTGTSNIVDSSLSVTGATDLGTNSEWYDGRRMSQISLVAQLSPSDTSGRESQHVSTKLSSGLRSYDDSLLFNRSDPSHIGLYESTSGSSHTISRSSTLIPDKSYHSTLGAFSRSVSSVEHQRHKSNYAEVGQSNSPAVSQEDQSRYREQSRRDRYLEENELNADSPSLHCASTSTHRSASCGTNKTSLALFGELLDESVRCIYHLDSRGNLKVICPKAERKTLARAVEMFMDVNLDKKRVSVPGTAFEPTGYVMCGKVRVFVHMNDITSLYVDAITSPSNPMLEAHAGLAGLIATVAGSVVGDECNRILTKKGRCLRVGEVVHTRGGKLWARYVLHVTGPVWPEHPNNESMGRCLFGLIDVFHNVIRYADGLQLGTIALPPISAGIC